MKHAAVAMDMEGGHKLVPLDEDVSKKWRFQVQYNIMQSGKMSAL